MVGWVGITLIVVGLLYIFTAIATWLWLSRSRRKAASVAGKVKPAEPSEDYVEAVLAEPAETPNAPPKAAQEDPFAELAAVQISQPPTQAPETVEDMGFLPSAKETARERKNALRRERIQGICKYCKGEYANLPAHLKTCKFRKGGRPSTFLPQKRRIRRTNAEIAAAKAAAEASA